MNLPKAVKGIKTTTTNPGDVIVIKCAKNIPEQSYEPMGKQLRKMFPNHKVIVLTDGITLDVKVIDNSKHSFCAQLYEAVRNKVMANYIPPLTKQEQKDMQDEVNCYLTRCVTWLLNKEAG